MNYADISLPLRDNQLSAKDVLLGWINDNNAAVVNTLVAQVAFGKSACTIKAIGEKLLENPKTHFWIIVHRTELVNQFTNEFKRFAPWCTIGYITRDSKDYYKQVTIVQIQTLQRYIDKLPDNYKLDYVIYDEAHTTSFDKAAYRLRQKYPSYKQINLTGTPVRHGNSNIQYYDVFPRKDWYIATTAEDLIKQKYWKTPVWHIASEQLAKETAIRFSGMKINKAKQEYDETSQAAVMIDLLPKQLTEVLPVIGSRSTVWFCVNTDHAEFVYAVLVALGRSSAFVSGNDDRTVTNVKLPPGKGTDRQKIVTEFKAGRIVDYITIETATTGFDAPIAASGVFLRLTLSTGLFVQMVGRILRKYDGLDRGLLFDMVGNLGKHPFPEEIDWSTYDPSKRIFQDVSLYICKHCHYKHASIPVPLHKAFPDRTGFKFQISTGLFEDGTEPVLDEYLKCHGCGNSLYFDKVALMKYADWHNQNKAKMLAGEQMEQFSEVKAGINIGVAGNYIAKLTTGILYELGVWQLNERVGERDLFKDKSKEFQKRYDGAKIAIGVKDKLEFFTQEQKDTIKNLNEDKLSQMRDPVERYRYALALAYVRDYSPLWASIYWDKKIAQYPTNQVLASFFGKLCPTTEMKLLVRSWLQSHVDKYIAKGNRRTAGLIKGWIAKYT